jgi:hypothetical protein
MAGRVESWPILVCAAALLSCREPITPNEVKQIKVCETNYAQVKEMFGTPEEVGLKTGLTTWTYGKLDRLLVVAFNKHDVVVDFAYNTPDHIELSNNCTRR